MANAYGGNGMGIVLQIQQTSSPYSRASSMVTNSQETPKSSCVSGTKLSSQLLSRFSREENGGSVGHCMFSDTARGPTPLHNHGPVALSPRSPLKVASHAYVRTEPRKRDRFPVSCSARGSSSSSSGSVGSPGPRKHGGLSNQVAAVSSISDRRETFLQFPTLSESDRGTSEIRKGNHSVPEGSVSRVCELPGNSLRDDSWITTDNESHVQQEDTEHEMGPKWAKADVSQSRVTQSWRRKDDTLVQNDRVGIFDTGADELNLVENPGLANGLGSLSRKEEDCHGLWQQKRRTEVFNILARDMDVIREGISWVQQVLLPRRKEAKAGVLMNKSLGGDECSSLVVEPSAIRHEAGQETDQIKARLLTTKFHDVDREYLGSEFRNRMTFALLKVKEELVTYLNGVTDGLVQGCGPLLKRGEVVGNRMAMDKIIVKDLKVIREGINLVKKNIKEVLRMRHWEASSAAADAPPPWPQPKYHHGLSAKDLLAADLEALKSYGNYVRGFVEMWRVPLQLSYDPEAVTSYFNRRPHVLIYRLLEVSAAFSAVALQLLLDKARLRRDKSDLTGEDDNQSTLKSAKALKNTLIRLGPTFIKVAQSLSSRPDVIGTNTAKVLSDLQDRLPPFPTEDAMVVIEEELGVPASQVFSYLSEDPVAAASFGQVYKGRTVEGEEVAVKVQRPDLLFNVARDIYVLRLGLGILRKLAKMNSDISVLADELGRGLFGELDYTLEAANAKEFEALHRQLSYVKVPRSLPYLTRKRVLTMEWINGDRPLDLKQIAGGIEPKGGLASRAQCQEAKLRLDSLVRKGVQCSLVQLLDTGVMHADPHPGNLLYTREGVLAYLDFGLLAHVEKKHQTAMLAVIAHLVNGEWQCLANDFADLDILKPSTDRFALRLALERAFGEGPDAVVRNGLPDIQFGQVTGKLWKVALKFRFRLPAYYTLVLRSLASLEGIAVSVDPGYKVFAAAYPYVIRRLLIDNSPPNRRVLQSLVLTRKREFRWDRIVAIMATSTEGSPKKVGKGTSHQLTVNLGGSQPKKLPHGKALALSLLSFTLSKEGASVRRILLEADTKSLAEAFVSAPASSLRREVSCALAEAFYLTILDFTGAESNWSGPSSGAGYGRWRMVDTLTITKEVTTSELSHPEILPGGVITDKGSSFQLPLESTLKNQRLWFLLKALASRLRSSPIFMLRVSWVFITMVGFAAALALHEYAITLSDRFLSAEFKKTPKIIQRPAGHDKRPRSQIGRVYASPV